MKTAPRIAIALALCIGFSSLPAADLVLTNGNIRTVNAAQPTAQALVIENGGITFVGSNADAIARAGANMQVVDLGGKIVLPGFRDVHNHIMEAYSQVNPETLA